MKTFTEQYNALSEKIESQLTKLISWKGEPSDFVNEPCLKITFSGNDYVCDYDEIAILHGKLCLIDTDGLQYNLCVLEFDTLCELIDKLSIFNPNDNKDYPVRILENREIDLCEYPNFHKSGSVYGMKKQYYGKGALLVRDGDYIYNVTADPKIYFEHAEETENQ